MRFLICTGLFLFLLLPLHAEEDIRYYDIELVVFENLEENSENNEVWPSGKQLQIPETATQLGRKFEGKLPPQYTARNMFKTLATADYQLTEEVEGIQQAEQYRLLLHTGWRQPGLPRNEAITVYLNHAVADQLAEDDKAGLNTPASPGSPPGGQEAAGSVDSERPANIARLEGLITIGLARYLHLDVELLYKKSADSGSVDMYDSGFLEDRRDREPIYYIKQNRRMRSKETHFIDHPRLGMLVRITPYEIVTKATPTEVKTRSN